MKQILLISISVIIQITLSAQTIDSLERLLQHKTLADSTRIDVLNTLGRELTFIDPIKAATYVSDALQSSLKSHYEKGEAYGYRGLSSIFSSNSKSIIAAEYLHRALTIFERLHDSIGIANCYITMGHAFRRSQRRSEEIEYHKRAYEYFSRIKREDRIAVTAHNLGESFFLNGEYQKSRALTAEAISLLSRSVKNMAVLSNCFKVMGKLDLAAGNLNGARQYFLQALAISDTLGKNSQKNATIESLIALASIYHKEQNRVQGLQFLHTAATFCKANTLPQYLQPVYGSFLTLYAGNKDSTLHYLQEWKNAYDTTTIHSLRQQWTLEKLGGEIYDYLENANRSLEKKYILQEQNLKSKNVLLLLSSFALLIFLVLVFALIWSLQRRRKAERAIKYTSEQLRELAAHLQNVREEERISISHQVHEELGQQLIVIKMDAAWMKSELEKFGSAHSQRCQETLAQLDTAIATIKRIATSLRPSILDDIGLETAIKWELSELEKRNEFKVDFVTPSSPLNISEGVKTGLYRIFQKAMKNVTQHSKATHVTVRVSQDTTYTTLLIEDNGIGFSRNDIASKKNIGMLRMKERCFMMNGSIEFESTPGKGTRVTVIVPREIAKH